MQRNSQNNDNRFYAYLPPTGPPSSRNSSSQSINPNSHYQYYDPRLRAQHNLQQNLYEYQFSPNTARRPFAPYYGSPRHQYHYPSSSSLLQDLSSIPTNSISDLGEPISVFDDIQPLEHRQPVSVSSLSSRYMPPDASRRPSATEVRLATAHVLREQLMTDIERTMTDIERDLTSLERRPSVPRYLPPRFSPIAELETHDFQSLQKPVTSVAVLPAPTRKNPPSISSKRTIPSLDSPVKATVQHTSARSTATSVGTSQDRNSGGSQNWPSKPKRVYEVIPRLTSDSKRTSRQSSVVAQPEQVKIADIQSPQTPARSFEKSITSASIQYQGQYHYAPEAEEVEILASDIENVERKSPLAEFQGTKLHQILNPSEFLRQQSPLSQTQNRAVILVPEYSSLSPVDLHRPVEDLVHHEPLRANVARPLSPRSEPEIKPMEYFKIHDIEPSFHPELESRQESAVQPRIASAPKSREESPQSPPFTMITKAQIHSAVKPRIPSRSTMTPAELYHKTEDYLFDPDQPTHSKSVVDEHPLSRTEAITPITNDDQQEKAPSPFHPPHSSPLKTSQSPAVDENDNGVVAYFFSEFDNEGDGEEDLISVDHSNFNVPTGGDVITDDETSSRVLRQSQASFFILQSAQKVYPSEPKSAMPITIETNEQHRIEEERKTEEKKKETQREKSSSEKERILTPVSLLPYSSPSPKQVLPISIMNERQTPFSRKSSTTNDDQRHRQTLSRMSRTDFPLNQEENEEKRSNDSQIRIHSSPISSTSRQTTPRAPSGTSQQDLPSMKQRHSSVLSSSSSASSSSSSETMHETDRQIPTQKRSNASSRRSSARKQSGTSHRTTDQGHVTPIESSRKSSIDEIARPQSLPRKPSATQIVDTKSVRSRQTTGDSPLPQSHTLGQSFNLFLGNPTHIPNKDHEPNSFSAESEHFLRHQSQSPYEFNQRVPSNYVRPASSQSSRQSSTAASPIPVTLDSPDAGNNPPATSRTATPKKKSSVSHIELPPDPRVLLTTTDEPDPDNPSVMQSTIHFRMFHSGSGHRSPSPLQNLVPSPEPPVHPPSIGLPMDFEAPASVMHDDRSDSATLRREENDLSPVLQKTPTRLPSATFSDPGRDEGRHQLASPAESEPHLRPSEQTPQLSYPARLEDLMRPTPSPFRPVDDIQSPSEQTHVISRASPPEKNVFQTINPIVSSPFDDNKENEQIKSTTPPKPQRIDHFPQAFIETSPKRIIIAPPKEPTFITETGRRGSSERSPSSTHSQRQDDPERLHRGPIQLSSTSININKHRLSSPKEFPENDEIDDVPHLTPSQLNSKLSLRLRKPESRRKKVRQESVQSEGQIDTEDALSIHEDDHPDERKLKSRRRRRVSFSNSIAQFQMEERHLLTNWRERVAALLASKHDPHDKYAHVTARVNSFANFEYQPRKIKTVPRPRLPPKTNEQNKDEENKFPKRKKSKVKKAKLRSETSGDDHTDDDALDPTQAAKEVAPQLFGRLWCLPDGSPTVFHESLEWNVQSRLKSYSSENLNYETRRRDFKIFNKKPKWNSESKLNDLIKETPRTLNRHNFTQSTSRFILGQINSLPIIPDDVDPYLHHSQNGQRTPRERKIFDIQKSNGNASYRSDVQIFDEKLSWDGKSRLKDTTWENINYEPKKSHVQIFHKTVHWNSEPKIRTRSPSTINRSRSSNSQVRIFDEKLNWDAQAKVHCWSEIDLRQLSNRRAIFAPHDDPKWSDVVTARVDATNYHYPRLNNHVEIFSDRLAWTRGSKLKDYVWENFDYKSQARTRQSNHRRTLQAGSDQTPPNRPRWNAVSKKSSTNLLYNPKVANSTTIRKGWDRELRRKRVHKLPPLKRKREGEDIPQLAIEGPPSTLASTTQFGLEYNYDHSSTTQGRTTSNGYITTSSRRSSKALVPLNHHRFMSELELPTETPRSQRPVQQEWYDEMTKSRLTQRTDGERATTTRSIRHSIDSIHHPHTPKDLVTFRSSTRNSQNSAMSGTLLDSSIRSNRATELRLSKDMDEHHHHSHTPSQSMPIEIRGFQLEGTPLIVPDHATIRPLSNVNYQASERVKSRRVYPWSSLHPPGTTSRNSSLVPIAELRRPSLDTTITEAQQLNLEE